MDDLIGFELYKTKLRAQNNGRKNDFYIFSFSVQGLHHYSLQSMRKFIVSKEQAAKDGTQLVNWVEKKN